jgi:hypothetical protein
MKEAVNQYIPASFKDPASVQDLSIGTPFFGISWTNSLSYRNIKDWIIPFSCNAKNSYGGYTGIQQHAVCWSDGSIRAIRKACSLN